MTSAKIRAIDREQIVSLLARTLGDVQARAVLDEVTLRLGILPVGAYSLGQAWAIVDRLSATAGIVGVAGRFTRVQLNLDGDASLPDPLASSSTRLVAADATVAPRPEKPTPRVSHVALPATGPFVDLLSFFVPVLGDEKAREALEQYGKPLGLQANALSRAGGILLLDELAKAPGLLGVVASFAKVKFLLRYPA